MKTVKLKKALATSDLLSENLYKLTLGSKQEQVLVDRILRYLKDIGADGPTILSKFSPEPQLWIIPPLVIAGDFYGHDFSYGSSKPASLTSLVNWYRTTMIKLDKSKDAKGLVNFAIKFVLIAQMSGDYKRLTISGSDCYIEFTTMPPAGIRDNEILGAPCGTKIEMTSVEEYVRTVRGMDVIHSHSVYDRIKLWMDESFDFVHEYENLEFGLAMLKRKGSYKAAYLMEQGLFNLNRTKIVPPSKFDLDLLDEVRDMWSSSVEIEQKVRDLYDKLVGREYLAVGKWKSIFGVYPVQPPEKYKPNTLKRLNKGMDKFVEYVLLEIRRSKQC